MVGMMAEWLVAWLVVRKVVLKDDYLVALLAVSMADLLAAWRVGYLVALMAVMLVVHLVAQSALQKVGTMAVLMAEQMVAQ